MSPRVPPSKAWLDGIKGFMGISENHPSVIRILDILRNTEADGEITTEERKEFHLLDDELHSAHEFIHGKIIYPTGEVAYYPKMYSRAELAYAIDRVFELEEARETTNETPSGEVAMPDHSNTFRAIPLRKMALEAGIDEKDPLLVRALEAQEKAEDWKTNPASWIEMETAVWACINAHFAIKDAWPPETERIEALLGRLKGPTASEVENFRQLAAKVLRDWQPQYSPAFKERINSAISLLDAS
jgi:hypothetical protein